MNKVFKVVFSHVLGRHVVVSELASSIQRGVCKAVVVAALTAAASGSAWAEVIKTEEKSNFTNNGIISVETYTDASDNIHRSYGSIAKGLAGMNSIITTTGNGSVASGRAMNGGTIRAALSGSYASGFVTGENGAIIARGQGSYAFGQVYDSTITATSAGSIAKGYASGNSIISAQGSGSYASGHVSKADDSTEKGSIITSTDAKGSIASGKAESGTIKTNGHGALAMGYANTETVDDNTKTYNVIANGKGSVAIGHDVTAAKDYSTALGDGSKAYGTNSLAALGGRTGEGTVTKDDEGNITVTTSTDAEGALAIGKNAIAEKSYTYAIGQGAEATEDNTIAIGNGSKASVAGGVALGSGSVADREAGKYGTADKAYDASGSTHSSSDADATTWISQAGAISVGGTSTDEQGNTTTITRQITGVAAGSEDTDAVNVAQLKSAATTATTAITAGSKAAPADESYTGTDNNIRIAKKTEEDGHSVYDIKLSDTVTLGSSESAGLLTIQTSNTAADGANVVIKPGDVKVTGANSEFTDINGSRIASGYISNGNGNISVNSNAYGSIASGYVSRSGTITALPQRRGHKRKAA